MFTIFAYFFFLDFDNNEGYHEAYTHGHIFINKKDN